MAQISAVETLRGVFRSSPTIPGASESGQRGDSSSRSSQAKPAQSRPAESAERSNRARERETSVRQALEASRDTTVPASSTTGSQQTSKNQTSQSETMYEQSSEDSRAALEEGTELLNEMADTLRKDIDFEVIGSEGIVQARIKNADTGEEIRSIPSDEVILVREKIDAFLGVFIDELR